MDVSRLQFGSPDIFAQLAATTRGLQARYPTVDGEMRQILYADSGATALPLITVERSALEFSPGYGSPHSGHGPAQLSTRVLAEAHEIALRFAGAGPKTHDAIFMGDGTTDAINWVAMMLKRNPLTGSDAGKNMVIFDGKGHHANINPWIYHLGTKRAKGAKMTDWERGTLPVAEIAQLLEQNKGKVRLVAITGLDNLMGIVSPIREVAELAHRHGALLLVDGAHFVGHAMGATIEPLGKMSMTDLGIDILCTSPHKFHARSADGIVIAPREFLQGMPVKVGGGHVKTVTLDGFTLIDDVRKRHEAGTPNVMGALLAGVALTTLEAIGMQRVWEHDNSLADQTIAGLLEIAGLSVLGDNNVTRTPRAAVISFVLQGLSHAKLAQALFDYRATAIRHGCHCAQPAAAEMLRIGHEDLRTFRGEVDDGDKSRVPGMARGSWAVYTTKAQVDRFIEDVTWVADRRDEIDAEYEVLPSGAARRKDGWNERIREEIWQRHNPYAFASTGEYELDPLVI